MNAFLSDACASPLAGTSKTPNSVLLFAAEPAASRVAEKLQEHLGVTTEMVLDWDSCRSTLRRDQFTIVLVEESFAAVAPDVVNALYEAHSGIILEINFGLATAERIARQVRSTLRRSEQNERQARTAAVQELKIELSSSLVGLLFQSELALRQASPQLSAPLGRVVMLAKRLCDQVRVGQP